MLTAGDVPALLSGLITVCGVLLNHLVPVWGKPARGRPPGRRTGLGWL